MVVDNIAVVENFLSDFFQKKKIFGIRYLNQRLKNTQTVVDLELTHLQRDQIIDDLIAIDYCEGPKKDKMSIESDMWVFGKIVKKKEIYIKITIGDFSNPVICISFHLAEKPMQYVFKTI